MKVKQLLTLPEKIEVKGMEVSDESITSLQWMQLSDQVRDQSLDGFACPQGWS
jgi:hypothetical protein